MVIRKRTKQEDDIPKKYSGTTSESEKKPPESKQEHSTEERSRMKTIQNVLLNILKVMSLIIIVPAFLNFAALMREEKELKPDGKNYYIYIYIYYFFCKCL